MAKKSSIERNNKRVKLARKYEKQRQSLKKELNQAFSLEQKWEIQRELQSLPRNSAPSRVHRRCFLTGRPRGVYRDFGLSRHVLREMSHECLLPGVTKSSW
uniref:Small ribosomal subunit protein uS14c n=1 Tax=Spirogyra maxima TaxID=3180 RepID=A0A191T4K8_SPIMX|nr:ribosomal protein S14 [Spirogyra maxima]ANI25322.1 ribosomal protein S14 [Spirogyra maxima]